MSTLYLALAAALLVGLTQEAAPAGIPAAEARLYSGDGGFVFANGRDARNIPFEINADKIYIQVRLNSQGDWLTAMDGQPLGELPLELVRRRLRGPAASKVDLAFERGGEPVRVTLLLRRVL